MFKRNSNEKNLCPFLREPCIENRCKLYVQILGHNPNTGEQMNRWDCSFAWMPFLQIEGSQQTRQAGAAIESFRNQMVRQNDEMLALTEKEVANHSLLVDKKSE